MSGRDRGTAPGDGVDAEREVPVDDERSADDADLGWGDRPQADGDDERYLRDRPPHWQ